MLFLLSWLSVSASGGNDKLRNISMYLILKDNKKKTNLEIKKEIEGLVEDEECEVDIQTSNIDMSALGGKGISVVVKGSEIDELKNISRDVAEILKDTEGTVNVSDGLLETSTEVRIIVDKNKAGEAGLTIGQIYADISKQVSNETKSTTLNIGENDYSVVVIKDDNNYLNREKLKSVILKTKNFQGEDIEIPILDIATITEAD